MKDRIVSNEEIRRPILRVYIQKAMLAGIASQKVTENGVSVTNKEALEAILVETTNELNEMLTSLEKIVLPEKEEVEPEQPPVEEAEEKKPVEESK